MRLSSLIYKGARMTGPHHGTLFDFKMTGTGEKRIVGACALGCAIIADSNLFDADALDELVDPVSELFSKCGLSAEIIVIHPVNGELRYLDAVIYDLNDCRAWSREKIAVWLRSKGY